MTRTALTSACFIAISVTFVAQERRPGDLEALLKRFDKDADGKISAGEFPRGEDRFRRLDRDRDGFLTRDDFPTLLAARPTPTVPAPEVAKEALTPPTFGEPTQADLDFFEKKIRPVLVKSCYSCHSQDSPKLRGALRVDTQEALLLGGASGASIVLGDPEQSLLMRALRYSHEELRMPPKGKLPDEVIADFERWIKMGAPDPRRDAAPMPAPEGAEDATATYRKIDIAKGKEFWAYRHPEKAPAPTVKRTDWALNEVDQFLLAELEERELAPAKDTDRRTWIRRASFDLRGLPPSPEEIEEFTKDPSPEAFEKVVDRYLASPSFGERWGRHWLDVARYAESSGKETNVLYPHAWRYRDYVIDSFNADKPYDRFLTEQIAGDLIPTQDADEEAANLIATGFLALGAKSLNTRDPRQFAMDLADEQIDTTTQAMLGVTVACARCHDHKFDPIPTEDYYALAGVFLSTETCYGTPRGQGSNHPAALVPVPWAADVPDGARMPPEQRLVLARLKERGEATLRGEGTPLRRRPGQETPVEGASKKPETPEERVQRTVRERNVRDQVATLTDLLARYDENGHPRPENRLAMAVREAPRPRNAPLLERGELEKAKGAVPRGFPQVLSGEGTPKIGKGSGRRELAAWIASPDNPLTARVMVNRIWLHLFGRGIVPTPDNLGMSGQLPSHPELLDWLAVTFVEDGWSVKRTIRRLVLSRTYRMASDHHPVFFEKDPEGVWLWRMPKRRLEGESIRDAMLVAAGTLNDKRPEGSPIGTFEGQLRRQEFGDPLAALGPIRSVYLPILRDRLPEALDVFDFADPSFVTGDREETNVATQALFLMNDPEVMRTADAMAGRLLRDGKTDDDRIRRAFELALGRMPSAKELASCREFVRVLAKEAKPAPMPEGRRRGAARRGPAPDVVAPDPKVVPWSSFCQALFQTAEFRYID